MSRFCNKHVKERTDDELKFMVSEGPDSKWKDNARRELKRRAGMDRTWSKARVVRQADANPT